MKMTEEYILSVLNGKETLENTKLLNIRYVVEPELKDGLTINDISNEYDYDTIWDYYYIGQMLENIAIELDSLEGIYCDTDRRDCLDGIKFKDNNGNKILAIVRLEDEYFDDEKIEGIEVNWNVKEIYINEYKFNIFNFDEIFNYLNSLLANGKFKSENMWWD